MELDNVSNYIKELESFRKMAKIGSIVNVFTKFQEDTVNDLMNLVYKRYYDLSTNNDYIKTIDNSTQLF